MSDKKTEARRLKGFRDHLPTSAAMRRQIMETVREVARIGCFQEVQTPALEYAETLLGQGAETDKQCYRFKDHGDRDVALRFDLTVPFARFVVEHFSELSFPFKRLQIGDVWRGENTQKGRYREFGQCDLDIVGVDSLRADFEVLAAFQRILVKLPIGDFTIRLGSRPLLVNVIESTFGKLSEEDVKESLILLDKLDKIGVEKVAQSLHEKFPQTQISKITALVQNLGTDSLAWVKDFIDKNSEVLVRFENLVSVLRNSAPGKWAVDLSVARGLAYYDGVVFETKIDSLPNFGSICSGGRYNHLAERFSKQPLPGVGGSLGLDRVLSALEELQVPSAQKNPDVFIAIATDDAEATAISLIQYLRSEGICCEIGLSGKVANQMKHADRLGARFAVVLGGSEVQSKSLKLKNMRDGSETSIEFTQGFQNLLQPLRGGL